MRRAPPGSSAVRVAMELRQLNRKWGSTWARRKPGSEAQRRLGESQGQPQQNRLLPGGSAPQAEKRRHDGAEEQSDGAEQHRLHAPQPPGLSASPPERLPG